MTSPLLTLAEIEDRLFTERRLRLFGALMLATSIVVFAWALMAGKSALKPDGRPNSIDFVQFFVAGIFADSPHPAAVYDYTANAAAQAALVGWSPSALPYYHPIYPPIVLLLTFPLGLLPYLAAFAVWVGGSFLLYIAAVYTIVPRAPAAFLAAGLPLAVKNAQLGQNGFLTAGLIGLTLICAERRPLLAGVFLGLLTYKPQFGLLFPLALLAGGCWRIVASAAVTTLVLAAAVTLLFGPDVWPAYIAALHAFNAGLSPDQHLLVQFQSIFGWLREHGASSGEAMVVHLVVAALVAALVGAMWYRDAPMPLRAAALATGSAAVTPYVLTYDLGIFAIAMAFLIQDGLARGFLRGERLLLALCVALSFLLAAPIAPVLYALLLGVSAWRWQARPGSRTVAAAQPIDGFPARQPLAGADEAGCR